MSRDLRAGPAARASNDACFDVVGLMEEEGAAPEHVLQSGLCYDYYYYYSSFEVYAAKDYDTYLARQDLSASCTVNEMGSQCMQ